MPSKISAYNAGVAFQIVLDEIFPKGCEVVLLLDGVAYGSGAITGRPMVSKVVSVDGVDTFVVLFDTRAAEFGAGPFDTERPFLARVTDIDERDDGSWESEVLVADPDVTGRYELIWRGDGPNQPIDGSREFVTDRWERELFPRGIEILQEREIR